MVLIVWSLCAAQGLCNCLLPNDHRPLADGTQWSSTVWYGNDFENALQ